MKEVKIKMDVDTSDAIKDVKKLTDNVDDVGQAAKKSKGGFKKMGDGIKAVGTAFKVAGLGLLVAIVAGLTEAFSRNKKVMDTVSIVMGTIQQVFSQVANALVNTYDAITSTSENFDALGKVITSLITIAFTPLKATFYGIIQASQGVKLAYEKMFGDKESIAIAQANLDATNETLKQIAVDAIQAGKDVVNNVGEAISEVGNIATVAGDNLSKVSIKAAKNQAIANKNATEGAVLAEANSSRLIAKYEREAELQRQIRDDVSKSVTERLEANNKLAEILDAQEKAMLKQADIAIAGAKAQLQIENSIENQAALVEALANKEQVRSDIDGKRSEQLTNNTALLREQVDLENTISDGLAERNRKQDEFDAEREMDPMVKLQMQREALDEENKVIEDDLARKRKLYAEGTADRIAAEEEYKNKKQDIENQITKNDDSQSSTRITQSEIEKDEKLATLQAVGVGLNALAALNRDNAELQKAVGISTAVIDTFIGANKAFAQGGVLGHVTGASIIAAGLANVATIATTKFPEGSNPTVPQTSSQAEAPSFNLVEGTDINQLQNSVQDSNDRPLRAFVVAQDVTSQQSLDRQIESNSGI